MATTQTTTTNNEAALLLQNQTATLNTLTTQTTAAVASAADALKSAWNKMVSDLKGDVTVLAKDASHDLAEGAQEIMDAVKNDLNGFKASMETDVKAQVNTLIAGLTKEASEDLKPKLQIFATELQKDIEASSQQIMADVWAGADSFQSDVSKAIAAGTTSGKVDIKGIASSILNSDNMKKLISNLGQDLTSGFNHIIEDAKSTWVNSLKQDVKDVANYFVNFGTNMLNSAKTKATDFINVLSKDVMAEVNEMTSDLIATGKKSVTSIIQTVIKDGAEVVKQAAVYVTSKVSSFFKKLFKW